MKVIQQLDPILYLLVPESPAIGSLDEMYNLLPQPWGGWDQGVKTDEVPCTNVSQRACRPGEIMI